MVKFNLFLKLLNSYECTNHSNNCSSCNNANTFRYLSGNSCLCSNHYFDNGTSNAICNVCDYKWLKYPKLKCKIVLTALAYRLIVLVVMMQSPIVI